MKSLRSLSLCAILTKEGKEIRKGRRQRERKMSNCNSQNFDHDLFSQVVAHDLKAVTHVSSEHTP